MDTSRKSFIWGCVIRIAVSSSVAVVVLVLGGVFFRIVEGWHELRVKCTVQRTRNELVSELWDSSLYLEADVWRTLARDRLRDFETAIHRARDLGVCSPSTRRVWSLSGAVYYILTVITTIGYGNVVPSTDTGRALTIVYALIGIPLLLTVLADLGKVFTHGIKFGWAFVRRFYYTGSCKRVRSVIPVHAVGRILPSRIHRMGEEEASTPDFVVDETFDLPVSVAILLLFSYILLGALMINQWEEQWGYFHAVYFVFVSLTTIGFGDMVPQHPAYLLVTFIYLLFGLALTSMCINVVQESLSSTFTAATAKLSSRIGLLQSPVSQETDLATVELVGVHGPNKTKQE